MIGRIFLILACYGGANAYVGARMLQWLTLLFPRIDRGAFAAVFIIVAASTLLGLMPIPQPFKGIMAWIGSYWLGIFIYLLLFFLLADVCVLLGSLAGIIPNPSPLAVRFWMGWASILMTTGLVSYGLWHANHLEIVTYDLKMKEAAWPAPLKVVLISDLHLGAVRSEERLERVIRSINGLEPDLVCLAGDIFNNDYEAIRDPDRVMELLLGLKSTHGVYACLGNHDGGRTLDKMLGLLERSRVRVLNDEHEIVGGRLVLIGRLDSSPIGGFGGRRRRDTAEILSRAQGQNLPVVVMDHSPGHIGEYDGRVDLVLSGHTHRGQVFPISLITRAIYEVDYGHYRKDDESPQAVVTSGAGTWAMPMRVGTNNEVVEIQLR
jgi:predicted MPP superfamily phosphohydrolase